MYETQRKGTNLPIAIFIEILLLNSRAEVKRSVVNQIRRVLGQIQHNEIEVQTHHSVTANNIKLTRRSY